MDDVQGTTTLAPLPTTISTTTTTDSSSPLKTLSPAQTQATYPRRLERLQGHKRTATGEIKSAGAVISSSSATSATASFPTSSAISTDSPHYSRVRSHSRSHSHGHSRGMSLDSNESRVAELSAQIRARLSYAASKVEQSWHSSPRSTGAVEQEGNQGHSTSPLSPNENAWWKQLPVSMIPPTSRQASTGSPEGTTVSAPDALSIGTTIMAGNESSPTKQSPISTLDNPMAYTTRPRSHSSVPPQANHILTLQSVPKLAPPADIVANSGMASAWRRRPNPNNNGTKALNILEQQQQAISPQKQQRRHGDHLSSKPTVTVVPGTPPLRPSQGTDLAGNTTAATTWTPSGQSNRPVTKQRTPSQNALMEQDAIETLLFMSSPENSGYHANRSSSQSRQQSQLGVSVDIAGQIATSSNGSKTSRSDPHSQNSSQNTYSSSQQSHAHSKQTPYSNGVSGAMHAFTNDLNAPIGLEAHAGDEIDRMLDQMDDDEDSDMEDTHQTSLGYETTSISATAPVSRG